LSLKPIIGVLGAIASGKSTVAKVFEEFGFAAIDADKIVERLYSDEQFIRNKIVPLFGDKAVSGDGKVNREAISGVVFEDKAMLKRLNEAVHPEVISKMEKLTADFQRCKEIKGVVWDVPLLVESGLEGRCDYLVFVEAQTDICARRAADRSGISKKEWEKRQNSQILLDKKKNILMKLLELIQDWTQYKHQSY